MNALIYDENNNLIRNHFSLKPTRYQNFENAFFDLRNKSSFGAVLINKSLINDLYFQLLYGTSHAYCSFWLFMLNNPRNYHISIPNFEFSGMKIVSKNYDVADIFLKDMLLDLNLYDALITTKDGCIINQKHRDICYKMVFNIKFLCYLLSSSKKAEKLLNLKDEPFCNYKIKILFSKIIVYFGIYRILKNTFRLIKIVR
jgi:hypothetical protein